MNRVLSPKISVVIPVYNAARFLDACISCLREQGVEDMQILLVNDGSKDNSLAICEQYAAQDARIQVYDKPNGGQSSARNFALRYAQGTYIAFLDSDDSLAPNTLSFALDYLESHKDCDFVQFPLLLEAGHPTDERLFSYQEHLYATTEELSYDYATEGQLSWRVCDKVFRRELLEGLSFVEGLVYEDNLYCTEAVLRAKQGAVIAQGCYIYNWNEQSTTHAPSPKSYVDMIYVHGKIYELLRDAGFTEASVHVLCLVSADTLVAYRGRGSLRQDELRNGTSVLRRAPWFDCLRYSSIPLKRRLKCLGMKVFSYFY